MPNRLKFYFIELDGVFYYDAGKNAHTPEIKTSSEPVSMSRQRAEKLQGLLMVRGIYASIKEMKCRYS